MNHRVSTRKDYTFITNTGQDSSGNHYAVLDHPLVFLSLQRLGEMMPCYDNVILVLAKKSSRQADEVIFDFSYSYKFNAHLCKSYGINKASIACGNTEICCTEICCTEISKRRAQMSRVILPNETAMQEQNFFLK